MRKKSLSLLFVLVIYSFTRAQVNLLVNGDFEDINTCTEYNSECGVEGWFYLKDVKAQMLNNDSSMLTGNNSFGLFYNWNYYTEFTPLIGALLPCGLQKDKQYTFKGMINAKINARLNLKPGIAAGEKFYVPRRPFVKGILPDSITSIRKIPNSSFYEFQYSFIADGTEKYLTFGTFISEDSIAGKKRLVGVQTVFLTVDNFQLIPEDKTETICADFFMNKEKIYHFDARHKQMDYPLYAKGELQIPLDRTDASRFTTTKDLAPQKPAYQTDTLLLADVLFDFNKAELKPAAIAILKNYFLPANKNEQIDSIIIEGHTDAIGTDARNMQLSLERSISVKKWLIANTLLDEKLLQAKPFGKSRPVATNETAEGRALNRRVELIIFRKSPK